MRLGNNRWRIDDSIPTRCRGCQGSHSRCLELRPGSRGSVRSSGGAGLSRMLWSPGLMPTACGDGSPNASRRGCSLQCKGKRLHDRPKGYSPRRLAATRKRRWRRSSPGRSLSATGICRTRANLCRWLMEERFAKTSTPRASAGSGGSRNFPARSCAPDTPANWTFPKRRSASNKEFGEIIQATARSRKRSSAVVSGCNARRQQGPRCPARGTCPRDVVNILPQRAYSFSAVRPAPARRHPGRIAWSQGHGPVSRTLRRYPGPGCARRHDVRRRRLARRARPHRPRQRHWRCCRLTVPNSTPSRVGSTYANASIAPVSTTPRPYRRLPSRIDLIAEPDRMRTLCAYRIMKRFHRLTGLIRPPRDPFARMRPPNEWLRQMSG